MTAKRRAVTSLEGNIGSKGTESWLVIAGKASTRD